MSQGTYRWLADENFPFPAFILLREAGWDIIHVGVDHWGMPDTAVMDMAIIDQRILLTFDGDHGTLVFKDGYRPIGVVYFRLEDYLPEAPGRTLLELLAADWQFVGYITVIEKEMMRQRLIPT